MNKSVRNFSCVAAVVSVLLLLTACSQTPSSAHYQPTAHASYTLLDTAASAALEQAVIGQKLTLATSPWGDQVDLTILKRYFAASGYNCLQAQVNVGVQPSTVVICQYPAQGWGASRDLRGQQVLPN